MKIVALDGTKLLILMASGGIFSLAGLWLMFRPASASGEAAKIKIFGLEFQTSSAGLLVFLIGAMFLAVPVFVPEKPAPSGSGLERRGDAVASSEDGPPARARANGREIEPNGDYEQANRLALGQSLSGSLARGDEDWFAIAAGQQQNRIEARIRSNSDCTGSYIYAYSPEERQLLGGAEDFGPMNTSKTWTIDTGGVSWIFVRLVNAFGNTCNYELFTGPATG